MGVKITDLRRDKRSIEFDYVISDGGDEQTVEQVNVTYRPSQYTSRAEQEINEAGTGDVKTMLAVTFVQKLVLAWDLEGEDGNPYPLDEDSLRELPTKFLGAVIKAVAEDMGKDARS